MDLIEANELSMSYGSFMAVKKCSFTVSKGEIVGLLGPNGAGKTTLMKILSTQIAPTQGSAKICGNDCEANPKAVRANIGYLPEHAPLYDDMEVREYINFVANGRGLKGEWLSERLSWVRKRCGLKKVWCKPIGELSKGYRQRVGLAQALIHDPPVLILDEPTSGLDPLQIIEIRGLIKDISKEKAILYSSHIIQEIVALSHRIIIINEGEIKASGPLSDLIEQAKDRVDVHFSINDLEKAQNDLESVFTSLIHYQIQH